MATNQILGYTQNTVTVYVGIRCRKLSPNWWDGTATWRTGVASTMANTFVGYLADALNTSDDSNGAATSPADWFNFENRFRGWLYSGTLGQYACNPGGGYSSCKIADLRLKSTGTVFLNTTGTGNSQNSAFVAAAACPTETLGTVYAVDQYSSTSSTANASEVFGDSIGDDDWACEAGETCTGRQSLLNAVEIMFDYFDTSGALNTYRGDQDGLCESNEACIYTPNFGAYQGHGTLNECTWSDNGSNAVRNVRMYGWSNNGI